MLIFFAGLVLGVFTGAVLYKVGFRDKVVAAVKDAEKSVEDKINKK